MIDERLARSLDCRVVAGAANNPLTGRAVADVLGAGHVLGVEGAVDAIKGSLSSVSAAASPA